MKKLLLYLIECFICIMGFICFMMIKFNLSLKLLIHDFKYPADKLSSPILMLTVLSLGAFIFLLPVLMMLGSNNMKASFVIRRGNNIKSLCFPFLLGKILHVFLALLTIISLFISLFYVVGREERLSSNYNTWTEDKIVAHAGGSIEGHVYTNCKEAIDTNYEAGIRTFEIDFAFTSDGYVVCKHDWDYCIQNGLESGQIVDKETFVNEPIFEKYTAISLTDLFDLMKKYPDIYIVTDTKDSDNDLVVRDFKAIVNEAQENDSMELLDRFIIQIYKQEMYSVVNEIYPFKYYIFTLYQFWDGTDDDFYDISRFCARNNIKIITCWNYLVNEKVVNIARTYGVDVYVHTENNINNAFSLQEIGVKGFYTDDLKPNQIN